VECASIATPQQRNAGDGTHGIYFRTAGGNAGILSAGKYSRWRDHVARAIPPALSRINSSSVDVAVFRIARAADSGNSRIAQPSR